MEEVAGYNIKITSAHYEQQQYTSELKISNVVYDILKSNAVYKRKIIEKISLTPKIKSVVNNNTIVNMYGY